MLQYLAERRQAVTEAVEMILQTYFQDAYLDRKKVHEEELCELSRYEDSTVSWLRPFSLVLYGWTFDQFCVQAMTNCFAVR